MFNRKPKRSPGAAAVRRSEAKRVLTGAVRMPNGWLTPEAVRALDRLVKLRYAGSRTAAICKALIEALKRCN